jgi:uncharacterized membrane protein
MNGLFNIDYPRFHALFTSNFAWSFLLNNDPAWLQNITSTIFKSSSAPIETIASIPGHSIYKRQIPDNTTSSSTESSINITGTGMSDFATAIGIDINALFFTMVITLLLIVASCLILCFLVWALFHIMGKFSATNNQRYTVKSKKMWDFTIGK